MRLFGTKEMAVRYGMRGKEVLQNRIRENGGNDIRNTELHRNIIDDNTYYVLSFYMGEFISVKLASKNPAGSWYHIISGVEFFFYSIRNPVVFTLSI